MATIGRGILQSQVFELFEGLRTFDAKRAVAHMAEDADFESPWNEGVLTGREKIQEFLEPFLGDAEKRPSFTIVDVSGDGSIVRLRLSVSGRFGRAPRPVLMHALCLKGVIHQVKIVPE